MSKSEDNEEYSDRLKQSRHYDDLAIKLDWKAYRNSGFGDPYADIPKSGGNYAKAVSVCINSLQCLRPINRGVMCPSFRSTQNPDYSPGGRVRLLKEALNDTNPNVALKRPELREVMSHCVSCKACKRECESNVDMASIKAEYLSLVNDQRRPVRDQLFASLPFFLNDHRTLLKLSVQAFNRFGLVSKFASKVLSISSNRALPEPSARSYLNSLSVNERVNMTFRATSSVRKKVFLLVDTFTNHYEPNVVEDAASVLTRLGYEVCVYTHEMPAHERPLCCGRTYYSSGDIDACRNEARRVIEALDPVIKEGVPIIGLEPSCILMLRDEYKTLGLGESALRMADLAMLFEEFIAKAITLDSFSELIGDYPNKRCNESVLIHGHCHEKSVGAMKSLRKVLKSLPGLEFELIESSCCGGAGSFGYLSEHSGESIRMAELALLPAIRKAPHKKVIANGFSCRSQIKTEKANDQVLHMATLLRRLWDE